MGKVKKLSDDGFDEYESLAEEQQADDPKPDLSDWMPAVPTAKKPTLVESAQEVEEESIEEKIVNLPISAIVTKSNKIRSTAEFFELWNQVVVYRGGHEYHIKRVHPPTHADFPGVVLTGRLCVVEEMISEEWLEENFGGGIYEVFVYGEAYKKRDRREKVPLASRRGISVPGSPKVTARDAHFAAVQNQDKDEEESPVDRLKDKLDPTLAVIIESQQRIAAESRRAAEQAQNRLYEIIEQDRRRDYDQDNGRRNRNDSGNEMLLEILRAQLTAPKSDNAEIERMMRVLDDTRKEHARNLEEERGRARMHLDMAKDNAEVQLRSQRDAFEGRLSTLQQELDRLRTDNRDLQSKLIALQTEVNKAQLESVKAQMEATHKAASAAGDLNSIKAAVENLKSLKDLGSDLGLGSAEPKAETWVDKALTIANDPRVGNAAGKALEFFVARAAQIQNQQQQRLPVVHTPVVAQPPAALPSAPSPSEISDELLMKVDSFAENHDIDGFLTWITEQTGATKEQMKSLTEGKQMVEVAADLNLPIGDLSLQTKSFLRNVLDSLHS